jgi:hypothetical protein
MQVSFPDSHPVGGEDAGKGTSPTILSLPVAFFISAGVLSLSYMGASARPVLVPSPLVAALVTSICFFLLLLPFLATTRTLWSILSPEVMGGIGYLIYIGFGAFTNHTWPGLAVNPSMFAFLPAAIIAQTAGALAFFVGTRSVRRVGLQSKQRETVTGRLALVILVYAALSFYISFAMPRMDAAELRTLIRAGRSVSWLFSVGPVIVFQALPMLVAARIYLREARFVLIRSVVMLAFALSALFYLVSGSRTYATQLALLLLVAHVVAVRQVRRRLLLAVVGIAAVILVASTWLRLSGDALVNVNPGTFVLQDIFDRAEAIGTGADVVGIQGVIQNVHENLVYHLSDNQVMALIIAHYDGNLLFGRGLTASLLSSLPRQLRPSGYLSSIDLIMSQFGFYEQQPADAPYWPDWQMSAGVMGFADFGPVGLLVYPFLAGIVARWVYNRTVLRRGLGEAGWLLYIPIVFVLWNPLLYGPDGTQALRLLIPLAIALRWTARDKAPEETSSSATYRTSSP